MIRLLLFAAISIVFITESCTYKHPVPPEISATKDSSDGLWVCQSFIDSIRFYQSAKVVQSHQMSELYMNFRDNYAYILDGFWEPKRYQIKKQNDSIYIFDSTPDSSLKIKVYKNHLIAENDSGYSFILKRPDTSAMVGNQEFKTATRRMVNEILVAGSWKVITGPANLLNKQIIIHANGSLSGLNDLSKYYEICISGDCKRYCDEADIIYISPKQDEPGGYWYCFKREGNKLSIWKVKSLEWMSDWPDLQPDELWIEMIRK